MKLINLMYHDILAADHADCSGFSESGADYYKLTERQFRAHLKTLGAISIPKPIIVVDENLKEVDSTAFTLSFDDGGSGAMTVLDILDELSWPAHFLVATDYIGKPGFMTKSDIRELAGSGHIIGSHSHTHLANMKTAADSIVKQEWESSTKCLEDILGIKTTVASVPYGSFSSKVASLAAATGIRHLFTSEPKMTPWRVNSVEVYGRYSIAQDTTVKNLSSLVSRRGYARFGQWAAWNMRKLVKTIAQPIYDDFRTRRRPT